MKSQSARPLHRRIAQGIPGHQVTKILRFGVVGGLGTLLNTLLVLLFLSWAGRIREIDPGSHAAASLAAVGAWIICCGVNYLLNAAWTFRRWPPRWGQAGQYYLAALSSFVIQILILNLLLFFIQTDRPVETAVLNGVAVATGSLFNYLFASIWVFAEQGRISSP